MKVGKAKKRAKKRSYKNISKQSDLYYRYLEYMRFIEELALEMGIDDREGEELEVKRGEEVKGERFSSLGENCE